MPGVCWPVGGEAALAGRSGRAAADTEPATTARRVTRCIGFSGSPLLLACLVLLACLLFFTLVLRTRFTRAAHELSSADYAYHSCGGRPKQLGVIVKSYAFSESRYPSRISDQAACQ